MSVPVLVVWGEQDGIAPLGYGRGYAGAFPNGRFAPIPGAGHFPQIEQAGATLAAITGFVEHPEFIEHNLVKRDAVVGGAA